MQNVHIMSVLWGRMQNVHIMSVLLRGLQNVHIKERQNTPHQTLVMSVLMRAMQNAHIHLINDDNIAREFCLELGGL